MTENEIRTAIRAATLAAIAALATIGSNCRPRESFRVQVVTPDQKPIAEAWLSVGFDWVFTGTTDEGGYVHVPNWASGQTATITKSNFYSSQADISPDVRVTLTPTPELLKQIGAIEGEAVCFGPETLVAVTHDGHYRVYAYSDSRATEIASMQLPQPVRGRCVRGDTFWYTTYDSGMYAYSIRNPLAPVQLMHLDVEGVLGPFTIADTFIVMGNVSTAEPLRTFTYKSDGRVELVSTFGNQTVSEIATVSHYLVVIGWITDMPVIFDITDIRKPREVYHGNQTQYWRGFVRDNRLVMAGSQWVGGHDTLCYGVIDLTDPAHPAQTGPFLTDSWLYDAFNDSMAVGTYNLGGVSVLRGDDTGGLHTVAIAQYDSSFHGGYWLQGSAPPYFILYGQLWKLVSPNAK